MPGEGEKIPSPQDVAAIASNAVAACEQAAQQLASIGALAVSMAQTFDMQCQSLASDFRERGAATTKNITDFAQFVHDQAVRVRDIRVEVANADKS